METPKEIIPLFKVFMSKDVLEPVSNVLMSGFIGQGKKVEEFETILKNYFHNYLVVTTNAATSATHLALRLLKNPAENDVSINGAAFYKNSWPGIQEGDEVLATPLTCTATNWPVLANNYKIKWVDVDPNTCNMDLDDLARKITSKTKVIIPVHWGGYPNDLDKIKEIQRKAEEMFGFKPAVIEDCAHAFGATYKGEKIGNHGNICFFSFQAIKHLTTADGGALVLPHKQLYDTAKLLRWYGIDRETNSKNFRCEDDISQWGYKFHMNDVNATIGIYNFPHAIEMVKKHKENGKFYNEKLKNVPGVTLLENKSDRESSYWVYTIKVENRDRFVEYMRECNIMVSRVHERNDKHSCVREFKVQLPNLDNLCKEMIAIPVGWWLSEEEKNYIVECIKKGW